MGQVVLGGSGGPAYVAPQGPRRDDWPGLFLERGLSDEVSWGSGSRCAR